MKSQVPIGISPTRAALPIKHLSPFRYPGGKSWFADLARRWLRSQANKPKVLVEPFGGGAGISLLAVKEGLVKKALFSEIDQDVAATWKAVLNGHATWLANEISDFRVSRRRVEMKLKEIPKTDHERAFQCLLKNRMARGGVLSEGAGLIRNGENGKGLHSRWYPETLAKRINAISNLKSQLCFRQDDAFRVIKEHLHQADTVFFVDPPYTQAARRLYTHWYIDHENLFKVLESAKGDVLITYDDTKEVRVWAKRYGFKVRKISMRTTHHQTKRELMISRNFDWLAVKTVPGEKLG